MLDEIPNELLHIIGHYLNNITLYTYAILNKRFGSLCNDNKFWKKKYKRDYAEHEFNSRVNPAENPNNKVLVPVWKRAYEYMVKLKVICIPKFPSNTVINNFIYATADTKNAFAIDHENNIFNVGLDINDPRGFYNGFSKKPFDNFTSKYPDLKARKIVTSSTGTLMIDINNNLFGWGRNDWGLLGLGHTKYRKHPTKVENLKVLDIAISDLSSCLIDMENNLYECGSITNGHESGELYALSSTPKLVISKDMKTFKAKNVVCGNYHVVFIDLNDMVWIYGECAGVNYGIYPSSLGFKAKHLSINIDTTLIVGMNDELIVFGKNIYGDELFPLRQIKCLLNTTIIKAPAVVPNFKVKDIYTYFYHSVVVDMKNNIWITAKNVWGENQIRGYFKKISVVDLNNINETNTFTYQLEI